MAERIQQINPNRIEWCCTDLGLTIDELAHKVSLPVNRLQPTSLQEQGLTCIQLKNVAKFLNRGMLFFLEDGPVDATDAHTPQFRTLNAQRPEISREMKAIIERTERQREVFLSLREDIDADWKPEPLPAVSVDDIPTAANVTREWLGLSNESSFECYRAAVETKGILVFRSNGYNGKWKVPNDSSIAGFALHHEICHSIFVRKLEPESRQVFTLMHELGHLLLHRNSFIDNEEDLQSVEGAEREANLFAGHVLVPDSFLQRLDEDSWPSEIADLYGWLTRWRRQWGVSGEVILLRMLDTGRIHQRTYDGYRVFLEQLPVSRRASGGARNYRSREPKAIFGVPYVRTVFDALRGKHITLSKASSYLDGIHVQHLKDLEVHIGNV